MKTFFHKACRLAAMALLLAGFLAGPASAASTKWVVTEGGRMRIVSSNYIDGTDARAVLQIEPAPGWFTYWREPGDGGIPPQFSTPPVASVTIEKIGYPVPKRIEKDGVREFGYDQPVSLPLDLAVVAGTKSPVFETQVFIGLCRNICIPFQASFSLPLDGGMVSNPQDDAIILAAEMSLPETPSDAFHVVSHSLSPDRSLLHVTLDLPGNDRETPDILVTGPTGFIFSKIRNGSARDGTFTADIDIQRLPKAYDITGKRWVILVKSGGRAMETVLAFD